MGALSICINTSRRRKERGHLLSPHSRMAVRLFASMLLAAFTTSVLAIGQDTCVQFKPSSSSFTIVNRGKAAPILLSPDEWPGVQRAASDFASDIQQVTGVKPTLRNITSTATSSFSSLGSSSIIVGTLGKSSLIDEIVNRTKLDVSSIEGKWEAFIAREVANPLPGVMSAYVVIGSDKRGTIFALYDHSEQFGAYCCILHGCFMLIMRHRRLSLVLVRIRSCSTSR